MSDMIENNNMFSVELAPWHNKGVVLDAPPTSAEAIVQAGMNWHVDKRQLFYEGRDIETLGREPTATYTEAPNAFGLFRDTDNKLFGVVSSGYQVVQNTDSFAFFDPLVQEGMAQYETAGVLTDGRVWILARVNGDMVIGGDEIRKYIMLLNDHSGSGSVILQPTPVRAVCNNTIRASLTHGMVFKHAHRSGVMQRMQNTKMEILGMIKSFDNISEQLEEFTQVKLTDNELNRYFHNVANVDLALTDGDQTEKVDRGTRNKLKAVSVMQDLYETGLGTTGETRGTLYGAYNAAIEFADWRMGARSKDRARYQLFGAGAELKERAYDKALMECIA